MAVAALAVAASVVAAPALAQQRLLPPGFFDNVPTAASQQMAVTADRLTYDADHRQVLADGHVEVDYGGYRMTGDHLVFDQKARTGHFVGDVEIDAPDGTVSHSRDLQLSESMREALMRQLSITTAGGALVTAGSGDFRSGDKTELTDADYAPCGQCIDARGHRIGWSAKATRMVYDHKTSNVTLEQPTLYLLGLPVAWLPWLSMPDPTKRLSRLEMPSFGYSNQVGARINVPYFIADGADTDILLTPSLMSRQGFLMMGEVDHRFSNGTIRVRASGLSQRDPDAFAGQVGDRTWRGAAQIAGAFTPAPTWTVGWSYTRFSDANYLSDYGISDDKSSVNEVYATHLAQNEFLDFRLQQFNLLGNVTDADQNKRGMALPNARYRNVLYLPNDMGELDLKADLLGVDRLADDGRGSLNGVPYNYGYEESKAHGTVEADWQKRWITPFGFAVTPFAGLRADAAYADYYDSSTTPATHQQLDLLNATPIAAVDIRFPMIARNGPTTQVLEPIAQLVYRASDTTDLGITNDNAQSFIFEDSNLFSYNRFSGTDRQETGLRANLGAHYQLNFDNGSWLDLIGGQSFQLAGVNAFAQSDPTQVTTGEGMSSDASYVVLGAQGSFVPGLTAGGKLQLDPNAMRITRGGIGGSWTVGDDVFGLDYLYIAKNPDRGVLSDQQEVAGGVTVPVPFLDYWKVNASGAWDLANNQWLEAGAGVHYDDGYLFYGADVRATGPTNTTPNDLQFTATINLKGLGGVAF